MLSTLFVGLVLACTGEDPDPFPTSSSSGAPPAGGDGGPGSADASSSSSGGGDGGGNGTDSGGNTTDSGGKDSGGPGGNRTITCETSVCTGADKCCSVGIDWPGATCKPDCAGSPYSLTCDDATDCGAGMLCCYTTDGGARAAGTYCAATCPVASDKGQLCKTTEECPPARVCSTLTQFSPSGLSRCN